MVMLSTNVLSASNLYDVSELSIPDIKVTGRVPHIKKFQAHTSEIQSHSADAVRDREVINRAVEDAMMNKAFYKALYIVMSANCGLRYSDLVTLRVCDVLLPNGEITDGFCLEESKTSALRSVYFNKAMKTVLRFIINFKNLSPDSYIFLTDGNRKSYFKEWIFDDDGNIIDVVKSGEKYDENGHERQLAPVSCKQASRWWKELNEFGADGKMSSHSARNTFRYFISTSGVSDEGDISLASQCMAHSSVAITAKHYANVTEDMKRRAAETLNLGLDALERSISSMLW